MSNNHASIQIQGKYYIIHKDKGRDLAFSNQLVPYLTEQRYAGRLIYSGGDDVLAYSNLWEWDSWLWDIRQCFRGDEDPKKEFNNEGDYWQYQQSELNPSLSKESDLTPNFSPYKERRIKKISKRPLFTMGRNATISFGVAIAHHSVPLAITLENMWEAEKEAKKYISPNKDKKDAVQVRILYGNGNTLKATAKFDTFHQWQELIQVHSTIEASLFEQATNLWEQHPAPIKEAIPAWTQAFCNRREQLKDETNKQKFQQVLSKFLSDLWDTTIPEELDTQIQTWLKLAAFVKRNREIKLGVKHDVLV